MTTVALTKDTFEDTIVNNEMVLVDFWAEWCGPCRMFGPVFEKVSNDHPDIVFAKVDTEAQQELAGYFNVRSIPTLMIFREQIGIFSQPGALPEDMLRNLVDQAKALDMDDVRKQMTEHDHGQHDHDGHDHDGHDHDGHDHDGHDHAEHAHSEHAHSEHSTETA